MAISFDMRRFVYLLATDRKRGFCADILKSILYILSKLYSICLKLHSLFFKFGFIKTKRVNCKVISIGNITWGGTGKTPLVEMLAKLLTKEGRKIAVLSRGYKRKIQNSKFKIQNYENMGDEAYLLRENLKNIPVVVGRDRVANAKAVIRDFGVDTAILDDGFGHRKIFRDLDIVTIDATDPFGNGCLLPRGILREPIHSLRRADIFVLTKTNLAINTTANLRKRLEAINSKALIVESIYAVSSLYNLYDKESLDLASLKSKKICTVSGIANPTSFKDILQKESVEVALNLEFDDHHEYTTKDLEFIKDNCLKNNIDIVLTTQKDAVRLEEIVYRLKGLKDIIKILVVRIELGLTKGKESFIDRLHSIYIS